jgi:hypothetical protein
MQPLSVRCLAQQQLVGELCLLHHHQVLCPYISTYGVCNAVPWGSTGNWPSAMCKMSPCTLGYLLHVCTYSPNTHPSYSCIALFCSCAKVWGMRGGHHSHARCTQVAGRASRVMVHAHKQLCSRSTIATRVGSSNQSVNYLGR